MKIYVVSKIVDSAETPGSTTVSAHVDKSQADAAAQAIAGRVQVTGPDSLKSITYGVVEEIELDLTGMDQAALDELRDIVG